MRFSKGITILSVLLFVALCNGQGDGCGDEPTTRRMGMRPPGDCDRPQNNFTNWEVDVDFDALDTSGRSPTTGKQSKQDLYYFNTTQWCEDLRPCPLHGGKPDAGVNSDSAEKAFQKYSAWTSGVVSVQSLTSGNIWVSYSLSKPTALNIITFTTTNENLIFVIEGSVDEDGSSWERVNVKTKETVEGEWRSEVVNDKEVGPKPFHAYRVRIEETEWSKSGKESGEVSLNNIQMCFLDVPKFHPLVASPPFIHDTSAGAFASSRWGRNWHENFGFYGPQTAWSSKWLTKTSQRRNRDLAEPQYIGFSFPMGRAVRKFRFMGSYQDNYVAAHPKLFSLEGSYDKENWTILSEYNVPFFKSVVHQETQEVPKERIQPFIHYRIHVKQTGWSAKGARGGYLIMRALRFC